MQFREVLVITRNMFNEEIVNFEVTKKDCIFRRDDWHQCAHFKIPELSRKHLHVCELSIERWRKWLYKKSYDKLKII